MAGSVGSLLSCFQDGVDSVSFSSTVWLLGFQVSSLRLGH